MDEEFDDIQPHSAVPGFVLPVATALVAVAVGIVFGGLVTFMLTRKEPEVVEVPRLPTDAELEAACAPLIETAAENLEEANEKVQTLEQRVAVKEAQVQELKVEMDRRASRGRLLVGERNALREELETARAELVTLQAKLDQAVAEKEDLIVELQVTREELVEKTEDARVAREESLANKWSTFRGRAQLAICERGRRKKMGRCREKVLEVLSDEVGEQYKYCIRSGQSVPSLHELARGERLPEYAQHLDEESRVTRDWFILLCDPTLPEAADLAEVDDLLRADTWGSDLDGMELTDDTDGPDEEPPADLDDLDDLDLDSLDD